MNTPTLSQLADIGAKAAYVDLSDRAMLIAASHPFYKDEAKAREAFAKAVLDAVGYKLPVDPEREAFDAWLKEQGGTDFMGMKESMFLSWKAGRDVLRKKWDIVVARCDDAPTETTPEANPAWIEWKGGPCPIPDTVKRWEYRDQDGFKCKDPYNVPSKYSTKWEHAGFSCNHIAAYRVLDWGTTKQPE